MRFFLTSLLFFILASTAFGMVGEPLTKDMADIAKSTVYIENSYKVITQNDNHQWVYVNPAMISEQPHRSYKFLRCQQNDPNCIRSSCTGFNSRDSEGHYIVNTALHCLGTPVMKPDRDKQLKASYDVGLYTWDGEKWKSNLFSEEKHSVNVTHRTAISGFQLYDSNGQFTGTFPYSTKTVGVIPGSMTTHPTIGASNHFYFDKNVRRQVGSFTDLFDFGSIQMSNYGTISTDSPIPQDLTARQVEAAKFNIPSYCPSKSQKSDSVIAVGTGNPDTGVLKHLEAEVIDTFSDGGWVLAKPKNPEQFVCGGDSGGPIFSKHPDDPTKHCLRGNIVAIFTSGASSADCTKDAGATGYFMFVDPRKVQNASDEEIFALMNDKEEWSRLGQYFPAATSQELFGAISRSEEVSQ